MNKKTHKVGGVTSVITVYPLIIIQIQSTLLFPSRLYKTIFLILALVLMFAGANYGLEYPDYDHQNSKSLPRRNMLTRTINKLLKYLGATHRSWHTHAMDFNLLIYGTPTYLAYRKAMDSVSDEAYIWFLFYVLLLSFISAIIVHLFLDLFTSGGGHPSILIALMLLRLVKKVNPKAKLSDFKVVLAPKWLKYPVFKTKHGLPVGVEMKAVYDTFTTSSTYENDFRTMLKYLNNIAFAVSIVLIIRYIV